MAVYGNSIINISLDEALNVNSIFESITLDYYIEGVGDNIKIFVNKSVTKVKELIKKIKAKIEQIVTKFGNTKYISVWKQTINKDHVSESLYKFCNKGKDKEFNLLLVDPTSLEGAKVLGIGIDPTKSGIDLDKFEEDVKKNSIKFIGVESVESDSNDKENKEIGIFESKNKSSIDEVIKHKSDIINILSGKYIYNVKALLAKTESAIEKALYKIAEGEDKEAAIKTSKACTDSIRLMSTEAFVQFATVLKVSGYLYSIQAKYGTKNMKEKTDKKLEKAKKKYDDMVNPVYDGEED